MNNFALDTSNGIDSTCWYYLMCLARELTLIMKVLVDIIYNSNNEIGHLIAFIILHSLKFIYKIDFYLYFTNNIIKKYNNI